MKKIFLIIAVLITYNVNGQVVNILSWTSNYLTMEPPGTRIQTNIPVGGSTDFRPVIMIDGYSSSEASIISLKLGWSTSDVDFANASVTSGGGIAPRIAMREEAGKVVIYLAQLDGSGIYRFNISGIYQTNSGFEVECYTNWTVSDAAFEFDPESDVIYHNEFSGDTRVNGRLIANGASIGDAIIGDATISGLLNVTGSGTVSGNFNAMGRVGIGTNNPASNAALDVNGKMYTRGTLFAKDPPCPNCVGVDPTTTDVDIDPAIDATGYVFMTGKLAINEKRTSRIGTNALAVNGTAIFTKAKVELNSTWPDYVFEPTYSLRSLQSLEEYLQQNKHLPDVPTANEVAKGGLDLGENQAILLKKIEELTLYMIDQNKRMDEQQKLIEEQRKMLLELKNKLK